MTLAATSLTVTSPTIGYADFEQDITLPDPYPNDPQPYPYDPIDAPGAKLLYRSAEPLEKALADTDAERLLRIHAELIIAQWDPYAISYQNLPYLAYAMSVNLWEDDYWDEGTKRDWVAYQWTFKSLRGTPAGIKMALAPSGYEVTDMVRPPQAIYAAPELTKDEYDEWIRQMPEIRIYWADRVGTSGLDEFFVDNDAAVSTVDGPDFNDSIVTYNCGFADQDAVPLHDGWVLRGRYAIVRHLGVDTPLDVIEYTPAEEEGATIDFERLSTYGKSTLGVFSDEEFVDDDEDHFVDFEEVEPDLYTLRLDREYSHDASTLGLSMLTTSLTPITPRYERNSDIGDGNGFQFVGDYCDDQNSNYATYADEHDGGEWLLADQIYLLDPDVLEPMTEGISFADVSRVGMPAYTAEIQIDLKTVEPYGSEFCEDHYVEDDFSTPEDDSHRERAFRAIVAAKAQRDTVLVAFDPARPLQMGDYLTDEAVYSDWVRQPL